jgi:hypothetical protein
MMPTSLVFVLPFALLLGCAGSLPPRRLAWGSDPADPQAAEAPAPPASTAFRSDAQTAAARHQPATHAAELDGGVSGPADAGAP